MTEAQLQQLDAVLAIANEVERHADAMDPRVPTAVGVLAEITIDLAGGLRLLTKLVRESSHYHAPHPALITLTTEANLLPAKAVQP